MKKILTYCIILLVIASCNKKDQVNDKELPVIEVTSPVNMDAYRAGLIAPIKATITDNNKLAEIHVHIYDNISGMLLLDIHRIPFGNTYSLYEGLQVQPATDYKIQVVAIDHSANQQVETRYIRGI